MIWFVVDQTFSAGSAEALLADAIIAILANGLGSMRSKSCLECMRCCISVPSRLPFLALLAFSSTYAEYASRFQFYQNFDGFAVVFIFS